MRKTIIFAIMMMAVCSVNAQLEMTAGGKLKLNSPTFSSALMNIEGTTTNIKGNRTGTVSSTYAPVFEGLISTTGDHWAVGVRGVASGLYGAKNCGVFGMACGSNTYRSFGVMGCTYSTTTKGAGIYGGNHGSIDGAPLISRTYAGYFNGDVHVQGNITYSGTMLVTSPASSNISESMSLRHGIISHLKNIDAQSYFYKTQPKETKNYNSEVNIEGMDSMEVEAIKKSLSELDEDKDLLIEQINVKQHYGLNEDQLEVVFPDLVYENEDGTKSINYVEMVPILVQAINELNAKIEVLEGGNAAKKAATRATGIEETGDNVTLLSLGQNKPNPFGTTTSIDGSIPESVQKAFIYVYDLQGKKVDQVDITARGKQTVQLNAATLTDGMYLYSLIADGKVVETRRMIVEK